MDKEIEANLSSVLDVSMQHITEVDSQLMGQSNCPCRVMESSDEELVLFYVDGGYGSRDNKMRAFGFSEAFIEIFHKAKAVGARLILFDPHESPFTSLPTFDW